MVTRGQYNLQATGKKRLFYGYVIVAASFAIMTVAWGSNRSFGVFLDPMLEDFHWKRASISGAFTLNVIIMGFMAFVMGNLTNRFGPRIVLTCSGLLLGAGYILVSQVDNIWQFYLAYSIMPGVGMSGILVPLMSVVTLWFEKRRALMAGVLSAGPALGIVTMPPAFTPGGNFNSVDIPEARPSIRGAPTLWRQ